MLSALIVVNTDQGDFRVKSSNFPLGTSINQFLDNYLDDAIYEELERVDISFEYNGEIMFTVASEKKILSLD